MTTRAHRWVPSITVWMGTSMFGSIGCDSLDAERESSAMRDYEIPTSPGGFSRASLGMGYNEISERFRGDCASGDLEEIGGGEAALIWERSMSREELDSSLGFEMEARARYGIAKYSGAAKFASSSQENSYSSSAIYSAQYRFSNLKLANPELDNKFENLPADKFVESCGHEYVEQVVRGAKIFISVKVDLHDEAAKQEFEAKANMKGPAFNVSASLTTASSSFSGRGTITVQAYQFGGKVSRLSAVLSGTPEFNEKANLDHDNMDNTLYAVMSCGFDDVESCQLMLQAAIHYATDVHDPMAFPQQIDEAPADVGYVTKPWATAGVFLPPAIVQEGVTIAREQLSSMFEEDRTVLERVRDLRKMGGRMSSEQQVQLPLLEARALKNISIILKAVPKCYDTIDTCLDAVEKVANNRVVTPLEELRFDLAPFPPGPFHYKQVMYQALDDENYCEYWNWAQYNLSKPTPPGPPKTWWELIEDPNFLIPDWDTTMLTMAYQGLCHVNLDPGLYWLYPLTYEGEGDQLCDHTSSTHFKLSAAPRTEADIEDLDPALKSDGAYDRWSEMFTYVGHCPVILPEGFYEYYGNYYWSNGVDAYCHTGPHEGQTVLAEEVPFAEFMTDSGECP